MGSAYKKITLITLLSLILVGLFSFSIYKWAMSNDSIRVAWHGDTVKGYAGYWYSLPLPKDDHRRVGKHGIYWKCNGWELLVDENEQIYLNGESYGKMSQGDELSVSWEGKLFLNGQEMIVEAQGTLPDSAIPSESDLK